MDPQHLSAAGDSVESSPRSRAADLDELPQVPNAKLRLMCSYGGQIIPRPHDKALSYVGGETRLVVVDRRQFSLASFSSRLSKTLLNNRSFTLKYQLPHEDLDSLISIATDEDLENMIEEYDRIAVSPARIRLFVFFAKPETTTSMGSLLDNAKSETWFVDALNESGMFQRNLSNSATMDCLQQSENSSAATSPSIENLPPIRVRVDEPFGQLTFAQVVQKQNDTAPPPPMPTMTNRVLSDDERSDQGIPVAFRKPPLPLNPGQIRPAAAHYNLPSPDSVASVCSIASSANSLSKQTYYQDHTNHPTGDPQDSGSYALPQLSDQQWQQQQPPPPQQQQQQFVHTSMHYTPVPISSCYQTYAPPGQHHAMDQQQYMQYIMSVPQTQQYNMAVQQQPGLGDATNLASPIRPPRAEGLPPPPKSLTPTPQLVQVPVTNQYQQQHYVGFSNPPQSIALANYGYEYSTNPTHDQVYYGQHQAVALPPQYQSMAPPPPPQSATTVTLADAANNCHPHTIDFGVDPI